MESYKIKVENYDLVRDIEVSQTKNEDGSISKVYYAEILFREKAYIEGNEIPKNKVFKWKI